MNIEFIDGLPVRTESREFISAEISTNFKSELLSVEYGLRFLAKATSDLGEYSHSDDGMGKIHLEALSGAAYVAHLLSIRINDLLDEEVKTDDD